MSSKTVKAKRLRKFTLNEAKDNKSRIAKVFIGFAEEIKGNNVEYFSEDEVEDQIEINYRTFAQEMLEAISSTFKTSAYHTAEYTNDLFGWGLKSDAIEAVADKAIEEYNNNYAASKVENITNTTRKVINRVIAQGQKDGLNVKDIAQNIVDRVDDMSKSRAMTISRTETSDSVNNTHNKTAEKAGMNYKEWIHTDAGKTPRKNHQAISGKKIKIDKLFDLGGGIKAKYPHDPDLPAKEVINCYCLCVYS